MNEKQKKEALGELRKLYGETANHLFKELDEAPHDRDKFLARLSHIHNASVEAAAGASSGENRSPEACQLFFTLASLLPTAFFKAVSQCSPDATFTEIRSAFMRELAEGLSVLVNILSSPEPEKEAKKYDGVEAVEITH